MLVLTKINTHITTLINLAVLKNSVRDRMWPAGLQLDQAELD